MCISQFVSGQDGSSLWSITGSVQGTSWKTVLLYSQYTEVVERQCLD